MANSWNRTLLDGDWELFCQQNSEYLKCADHPVTTDAILTREGHIPAKVPGNLESDLMRAGLISDPFFGQNVLRMRKLESLHMFYGRKFTYRRRAGTTPILTFEGLDTVAEIFLNGERVASCENMFITQTFELPKLRDGENDLVVHIFPACVAARGRKLSAGNSAQKYNYESLRLRKSASMFGWDIMPRIVSGGIYRPVYIADRPDEFICQAYLMVTSADPRTNEADLTLFYEVCVQADDLSEYEISVRGECEDSQFRQTGQLWFTAGKLSWHMRDAKLWWPKGYGKQPLYQVEVDLKRRGAVADRLTTRLGIRTVRLERTALTDPFSGGKFRFYVNDKKIFILGTNFVPIDALHSRDRERLPKVTRLLDDVGCNAIRCWGGGIYEDDYLYDFCDEKGILIWQDFCMACGEYPLDDDFCRVMSLEAESVIRRLRQHPSLLIWAGDNECDVGAANKNPGSNRVTREVIRRVVQSEDPVRPYLPSSPFVDREAEGKPKAYLPENHLWGPRDYYKSDYYKKSLCSFVSEIGYHGCPALTSIEKFIPRDKLWPWQGNDDWTVHASSMETGENGIFSYRIKLMADQIRELFGETPDALDDFVLASQISQAEALKFFIELFRLGQPDRSGIIWWNLIDGWPQFSDAVVDYYFVKKLAYFYIRQVQQPLLLAMREPQGKRLKLACVNDTGGPARIRYQVTDWASGSAVCEGEAELYEGVSDLDVLSYSGGEKKLYIMRWEQDGRTGINHYLAGNPPFSLREYESFLFSVYGWNQEGTT